jgi:hypothetical protein
MKILNFTFLNIHIVLGQFNLASMLAASNVFQIKQERKYVQLL